MKCCRSAFLRSLDAQLAARNPGAGEVLVENDVDTSDLAWRLSCTLPDIISVHFQRHTL